MQAKAVAAGIALRDCTAPAFDITNSVAMTCLTVTAPSETVRFATFEQPESGAQAVNLSKSGTETVYVAYRWWVSAARADTLNKLVSALNH